MRKILCLHGYRQNGKSFKDKTGSLRKLLKKHAELVYINAPHLIPIANDANETSEEQRAWYFSTEALTFNSHDQTDYSWGLEESVKMIGQAFQEQGPFDGILGFSQGAALASILCHKLERGELDFKFRFAILVSGFRSGLSPHSQFYDVKLETPSLHVIGETDRIVEKEMSEHLAEHFNSGCVVFHAGGHYVPATSKEKESYVRFLERFPITLS